MVAFVARQIGAQSEKKVIYLEDGYITYSKFFEEIETIKSVLEKIKLKEGDLVGICFEKCPAMIATMVALIDKNITFLPISLASPKNHLKSIVGDSKVKIIITNSRNFQGLRELADEIDITIVNLESPQVNISDIDSPNYGIGNVYAMYTSGSTGTPKGVLIKKSAMFSLFDSLSYALNTNDKDVFLCLTDYTFDVSLIELLMPLYIGASLYLADNDVILNMGKIKKILKKNLITMIQATPTIWHLLVTSGWRNTKKSLRILSGGEILPNNLLKLLNPSLGNVWNLYGPTETTMWSAIFHTKNYHFDSASVPIGRALNNQSIYILDTNQKIAEINSIGELYIGGVGLAAGYINNTQLNKQRFITIPEIGLAYKTGDTARMLSNGNIEYISRLDDQIKIGGIRVEPGEIVACLEKNSLIKKAEVIMETINENFKRIAAYVEIDFSRIENRDITLGIDYWKSIYDASYANAKDYAQLPVNPSAWVSSIYNEQLTYEDVRENLECLVNKINKLNHTSFYEDGCGIGNLISILSKDAYIYTAAEISETALAYLCDKYSRMSKVNIVNKDALSDIESQVYDCILMNSVTQYFPNGMYLFKTIEKKIKAIKSGGTIIIGDVRHKDLLDFLVIERNIFKKDLDYKNLYLRSRDSELMLSPKYFFLLKKYFPRISHIDINVKSGKFENELNFYRYDVFIYIENPVEYKSPLIFLWEDIYSATLSDTINKIVKADRPVIIAKVPNPIFARIQNKKSRITSDELKSFLFMTMKDNCYEQVEVYNHIFVNKLSELNRDIFVEYEDSNPSGFLKIKIYPIRNNRLIRDMINNKETECSATLSAYIREPYCCETYSQISHNIKGFLQQELPSYMWPVNYYWIEKWPTLINSKVDKKMLLARYTSKETSSFGKTPIENTLLRIWEDITGQVIDSTEELGQLGVSSLYFYHFLSKLKSTFSLKISFSNVISTMSIEKLAILIQDKQPMSSKYPVYYNS